MKLSVRESICLDTIRAVASLAVVFGHGMVFFGVFEALHQPNVPWMQNIAVVVFFVLSGFVITYSTKIKSINDNYTFFDFFADRASRIFSAYIVALIFVLAIDYLSLYIDGGAYKHDDAFNVKTFIGNVLMMQDYPLINYLDLKDIYVTTFGSARVLWTISVEWWIYMFFGVSFFILVKKESPSVMKLIVFIPSCVVVSWYLYGSRGEHLTIYWMFGMLWLLIYEKYKKLVSGITSNVIILMTSLSTCVAIQINVINGYDFYFAIFLSLLIISLINLSNYIDTSRIHNLVHVMAGYSFTLYLIHYSIIEFIIRNQVFENKYLGFAVSIIISNILAYAISRYSEVILRKQLRAFIYKAKLMVSRKKVVKV